MLMLDLVWILVMSAKDPLLLEVVFTLLDLARAVFSKFLLDLVPPGSDLEGEPLLVFGPI